VPLGGIEGGRAKGGDRSDLQTLGPIVKDGKGGGGGRGWGETLGEGGREGGREGGKEGSGLDCQEAMQGW